MPLKIHYILLLLLCSTAVFSQSATALENTSEKTTDGVAETLKPATVFQKKDLPSNQKVSPEIIYIINDKPVSREEYQKQLKKN
ncbi:hypothetical protein G4D82_04830 [Flavobacterium sp. CYK-4]|uniref:hypothetical protein n=1 Tax=Flavobacterium lotistagni TaxID=2709660 RepID=UPI0014084A28|nr:hypothetical protein [Flavobacterium lotistagni]NHM06537.1 hypothetical protein [Flavobacterium lotistagni]